MTSLINASSPLVWDGTMLAAAQCYAENNQATIITPFILAGAMAPATSAGVAAQTLAEALAGMAFVQLCRRGAPVVFGSFASSMSMQTGAPTFGTPEPALVLYTVAALARRLGVPFRSGGSLTSSKLPDAQAAYESANTLQPTVLGGVNFVLHAAGWLEGGLAIGYEKFVLDCDQLGMAATFVRGLDTSPNGLALGRDPWQPARQPLPRHRPHARQLRDRVLPQRHQRQLELRAVVGGRWPRRRPARQHDLEATARGVRAAAARRRDRRRAAGLRRPAQGRAPGRVRLTCRRHHSPPPTARSSDTSWPAHATSSSR
ncbi:MAG: trimethylamine methyltransferase family protein [Ilumatobacteraceae bacterium]